MDISLDLAVRLTLLAWDLVFIVSTLTILGSNPSRRRRRSSRVKEATAARGVSR